MRLEHKKGITPLKPKVRLPFHAKLGTVGVANVIVLTK